jgi:hypothetical protein
MDTAEYKAMVKKIRAELESLEIRQEEIERQIARLKQALIGLTPLAQEDVRIPGIDMTLLSAEIDAMSITDAARQILQASAKPLSPIELKQKLAEMGKDLSGQKNVMASVHSLLKRLTEAGQIESADSGLTYQWRGIRRFPRLGANAGAASGAPNSLASAVARKVKGRVVVVRKDFQIKSE